MKCTILESKNKYDLEERINNFIKDKNDVQISISYSEYYDSLTINRKYVACVTYEDWKCV